MTLTRSILVLGAGGGMTSRCLEALASHLDSETHFVLTDLNPSALEKPIRSVGQERCRPLQLDLFDQSALDAAIEGVRLVINGAGPYHSTAAPVCRACLAHRVDYLDLDDDADSTLEAIELDSQARDAGVRLFIGCGASPGITNVLARHLLEQLDAEPTTEERDAAARHADASVEIDVDVAWCVGDEGPVELGRSVIEHTLHMGAGDYVGWRNGARSSRPSWEVCSPFPLPDLEAHPFYECAHPEPLMLGRSFPRLRNVTCLGSLHPAPVNGLIRGISLAARDERLPHDAAVAYLQAAIAGCKTDKTAERFALEGMREQVARGEISGLTRLGYLVSSVLGIRPRLRAGVGARVRTWRNGSGTELLCTLVPARDSDLRRMDVITGLAQASFLLLALDTEAPAGCRLPEDWVDPQRFLALLASLLPEAPASIVSPIRRTSINA